MRVTMKITDIWKQNLMGKDKRNSRLIKLLAECNKSLERILSLYATATKIPINPIEISVLDYSKSIVLLAEHNHCKEVYIISRALIENLITYYYISCSDKEIVENYFDLYLKQKQYRKLNTTILDKRDKKVIVKASHIPEIEDDPELKKAIGKYTSAKGKPKTRWTSDNIEKMLDKIEEDPDVNTNMLRVGVNIIYSDASEALHGTSYGCVFPFGLATLGSSFNPITIKKDFHGSMYIPLFYIPLLILWHAKNVAKSISEFDEDEYPKELFTNAKNALLRMNYLNKKITSIMNSGKIRAE